jgi:tRNA(Ile)-lysidine synthase
VAARELRYGWFNELLEINHFDYLVTAHHADDNVETVLMNIFKGTGIQGMKGILPKRDKIVRPLLFATKNDIVAYAKLNEVKWREDASNASDKYTRNFFRNRIIPQVEEVIPGASLNVNETIGHLQEVEILYRQAIDMYRRDLLHFKKKEVHIPVIKFAASHPFDTIAYELLSPYGFKSSAIEEVKQLLKAGTGKYIASETHRIIKNRNWLIIAPIGSFETENIVIDERDETVFFENGTIHITRSLNKGIDKNPLVAILDRKNISFPLLLRKWKTGDYFYPLGMPKKKKIARFMIDQKLSKTDKEKIWVLVSNNKVVWIVGQRIDDRFKVNEGTKEVLKIRLEKKDE